nr:MAG TPA: hypothetical protein [Caudoviricetes sp.]
MDETDKQRLESVLEGIVAIITELQSVKTDIQNIDKRLTKVEQNQAMQQKSIADTHIMANNIVNDVEDIKSDISVVSDKIDALDNTVRNIRIFKYYGGEG